MRKLLLVACAGLFASCGGGGGSAPPPPTPTVISRTPAAAATDVTEPAVTVQFSEAMDPASLAGRLTVARAGGGAIAGTVAVVGAFASFSPAEPFPAAASLVVTVSAEARSAAGAALGTAVTWGFTTAHWRPVSVAGAPSARSGHTATWTGSELIVWGGTPTTLAGGRYDPATDTWRTMAIAGAPAGRTGHTATWTGTELIVWGGTVAGVAVATGARYDPSTNGWRAMASAGAPSARAGHTATWTGSELIVWGAAADLSGGRYDPVADAWTPTGLVGAPAITAGNGAAWTGTHLAIWGGYFPPVDGGGGAGVVTPCPGVVGIGAWYDPATDGWTAIPTAGAPAPRRSHLLAWTGEELLVWGGCDVSSAAGSGGRTDPGGLGWIATAEAGAPGRRSSPHWAWTGSKLLVWGGVVEGFFTDPTGVAGGGLFDPATDTWTAASPVGGAAALQLGAASAWTGTELIVWGGQEAASGARFTP